MVNGSNDGEDDPSLKRLEAPLGSNSAIGRKLKQYFDGLVSDEVPDRFALLLSQLEGAEAARAGED